MGHIYSSGWEEFGISIDSEKAKTFYDRVGVFGYDTYDSFD